MGDTVREFAKPAIFVAVIALLLVLNAVFGWSGMLEQAMGAEGLRVMMEAHPVRAVALYLVVTVIGCVALFMPGIVFAIIAGLAFGPIWGSVLCLIAATVGSSLSFLVGRYFLKDSLKPRIARYDALNRLLFDGAQRNAVFVLALTRLVPIFPFNLQNFAYGITDIRFAPYAIYSALFILPGTAVYTLGAAGIVDEENRLVCLVLAGVFLAATLLVAWILKRRANIS